MEKGEELDLFHRLSVCLLQHFVLMTYRPMTVNVNTNVNCCTFAAATCSLKKMLQY